MAQKLEEMIKKHEEAKKKAAAFQLDNQAVKEVLKEGAKILNDAKDEPE